jgi:hypothetical protein
MLPPSVLTLPVVLRMDYVTEPSCRRPMGKPRADAWRKLPPFDRLHDALVAHSTADPDPDPCPDDIPIYVKIEGRRVTVRINAPDEPTMRVQFRWRASHHEWQLFAREGSRWVADGPPRPSVGRLLERFLEGILLSNSSFRSVPGRLGRRPGNSAPQAGVTGRS